MPCRIHPNSWIDLSPVANDETQQFMAGAYTGNESNPGQGLWAPGVALEFAPTEQWYVHAVAVNADGRTANSALDTLHEDHFYEAIATGYKFGKADNNDGNVRVTGWHNNTSSLDGYGFSVGFDQEIADTGWTPFGRFGMGEADATAIKQFTSLGVANTKPFGRRGDMFGIGGTYAHPSDSSLRDEQIYEAFYRLKVTESLEFSPDIQWLGSPAFQPG